MPIISSEMTLILCISDNLEGSIKSFSNRDDEFGISDLGRRLRLNNLDVRVNLMVPLGQECSKT
jgi:hypothetical protein